MADTTVTAGTTSTGDEVPLGSFQVVYGTANNTMIDGGQQVVAGVTHNAAVTDFGSQDISSGGVSYNTTVDLASQGVDIGGTSYDTSVTDRGSQTVYGTSYGTTVSGGGSQFVTSLAPGYNPYVSDTTIGDGGQQHIEAGTVVNDHLSEGGLVDLENITYEPSATAVYDQSTNTLDVQSGSSSYSLSLAGNYAGKSFVLSAEGGLVGGALQINLVCFCKGTRILTPYGEVSVENLSIGDAVITAKGATRVIEWIGSARSIVNDSTRPVTIQQDAFFLNRPSRPLSVTRGHAFLFGDVLIPIGALVNGSTIDFDTSTRVIEAYHIGLAAHDIIIADGTLAESYRDDGNRSDFQQENGSHAASRAMPSCAPIVAAGPIVERTQKYLNKRAKEVTIRLNRDSATLQPFAARS